MVNSKLIRLSHGGITQNCYAKPKSKPYFAEVDLKKGNNNLYEISAYRAIMQFIKLPLVTVELSAITLQKMQVMEKCSRFRLLACKAFLIASNQGKVSLKNIKIMEFSVMDPD